MSEVHGLLLFSSFIYSLRTASERRFFYAFALATHISWVAGWRWGIIWRMVRLDTICLRVILGQAEAFTTTSVHY
jgi:hypothetical protein